MLGWNKVIEKSVFMETIDNDSSLLDTVIELFKQQSKDTFNAMTTAIDQSDWFAFERAAHDLKNIGRYLASPRLIEHSHELEKLAAERHLEVAAHKLDRTAKLLTKALKELTTIRKQWKK